MQKAAFRRLEGRHALLGRLILQAWQSEFVAGVSAQADVGKFHSPCDILSAHVPRSSLRRLNAISLFVKEVLSLNLLYVLKQTRICARY